MVVVDRSKASRRGGNNKALLSIGGFMSIFTHVGVAWIAFYVGLSVGSQTASCPTTTTSSSSSNADITTATIADTMSNADNDDPYSFWVPPSMERLFAGAALVERMDFSKYLDTGVPMDPSINGNEDVLLLYSSIDTLPNTTLPQSSSAAQAKLPHFVSAAEATEKCRHVKVVLTPPKQDRQCLAIMGQWESYHIHKFMRIPAQPEFKYARKDEYKISDDVPLRYVARNQLDDGRAQHMPTLTQSLQYYELLQSYLGELPETLKRLRPLAEKAGGNEDNAVVVLVCNWGQAELLFNFVCNARAKGLSLDAVLLFATDADTLELAQSLSLNVFDVQTAFGDMPTTAARSYGDKSFTGMMMAKVYCVHLISLLGYHVLFQDVDVVWYRDPLEYFRQEFVETEHRVPPSDIYFQDDGAHSPRYAPYSPNSGFYYVRNNWRTMYFFSVLSRSGDLIQMSGSHQSSLNNILSEQASSRGLRVKVFGRDDPDNKDFPGGFHFHKRRPYMQDMLNGKVKPYLFHMSWTANKENKVKFFQQLGDWYIDNKCSNKKAHELISAEELHNGQDKLVEKCCSKVPNFRCHYSDKPSWKPCKSSPKIDKNGKPFW